MRRRSWVWSCCWPSALSWRGPSASSNGSAGTREIDSVHRDPLASASPVSFSDLGECADPRFEPGGQPQGDQGHDRVPEGIAQLDPVHQNDVVDRGDLALLHQRDDGMEEVAKTALGGAQVALQAAGRVDATIDVEPLTVDDPERVTAQGIFVASRFHDLD